MHKYDEKEYVTYQNRNWIIDKISLYYQGSPREYNWAYTFKAHKWDDNMTTYHWYRRGEIWENAEGLELVTSPDMDGLIKDSLWRSRDPYVYGSRYLYHVISLTGRFDDENTVYYRNITGESYDDGGKSMTKTIFVTGYLK